MWQGTEQALFSYMPKKLSFFIYLLTITLLTILYPLSYNDTQESPSFTLNVLGLSCTRNINQKFHISYDALSISMVTCSVQSPSYYFLFLSAAYSVKRLSCILDLPQTILSNRVESKIFRLFTSSPLTDCQQYLKHHRNVATRSFPDIFYGY